jgi:hypothetical protein
MLLGGSGCAFAESDVRTRDGRDLPATDVRFMPPEGCAYMDQGDVWCLGMIIVSLASIVQERPHHVNKPLAGGWASAGLDKVLRKCPRYDTSRRANSDELPTLRLRRQGLGMWEKGRCNGIGGRGGLHCVPRDESQRAYEVSHLQ